MPQGDRRGPAYTFGPVPSRRLGHSLGINNIPPKVCSYSCVYCQVGCTSRMRVTRCAFYEPDRIVRDVQDRLAEAAAASARVDYLTFVPDGEPTLDVHLGEEIALLRTLGVPVGVITNSSLLGQDEVRKELGAADWVSMKIDAVREETWRQINRPHGSLRLSSILDGIRAFARTFVGTLVTETMLVEGLNDTDEHIAEIAGFLQDVKPHRAYLGIPTRPPAEKWVRGPDEEALNRAYQLLAHSGQQVEYLIGYEGDTFAVTGDVERDLLSITAVHPMREQAVRAILSQTGSSWEVVKRLVADGSLIETRHGGHLFYVRRLTAARKARA
jgi:wyosine [tRNA(Phe)-imidazoG37] synthetase (radical SAM superfamily)